MESRIILIGSDFDGNERELFALIEKGAYAVDTTCMDWICTRCDSFVDDSQVEVLLTSGELTLYKQPCSCEVCPRDTKKFCPAIYSIHIELTDVYNPLS